MVRKKCATRFCSFFFFLCDSFPSSDCLPWGKAILLHVSLMPSMVFSTEVFNKWFWNKEWNQASRVPEKQGKVGIQEGGDFEGQSSGYLGPSLGGHGQRSLLYPEETSVNFYRAQLHIHIFFFGGHSQWEAKFKSNISALFFLFPSKDVLFNQ